MSSPLKIFSALLAITLAACGFTPMYGSGGGLSGTDGMNQVEIALIPDESGVYLRNILIDHFYQDGYPSSPQYTLVVSRVSEVETDLDITVESETTRKQIQLNTAMSLIDKKTGKAVVTRSLTALTSYNVLGSQFTTRISEADAREASLADLARQIENHVVLYFKR